MPRALQFALSSLLLLVLSASLVVASSPALHQLIHSDSRGPNHECSATLLQKEQLVCSDPLVTPVVRLQCVFAVYRPDAPRALSAPSFLLSPSRAPPA